MARRRPRAWPRPKSTERLERGLARDYRRILEDQVSAIKVTLEALLPGMTEQALADRGLRSDTPDEELERALEEIEVQWSREHTPEAIEGMARRWGLRVNERNRESIQRGFKRALAVDAIADAPHLQQHLETYSKENARLIKGISSQLSSEAARVVRDGWRNGDQHGVIAARLAERLSIPLGRADLVASDQVQKLDMELGRERFRDAGVESFRWRTSKDGRVRALHRSLEGRVYPLEEGHPTERFPGWPVRCRCWMEPVLEDDDGEPIDIQGRPIAGSGFPSGIGFAATSGGKTPRVSTGSRRVPGAGGRTPRAARAGFAATRPPRPMRDLLDAPAPIRLEAGEPTTWSTARHADLQRPQAPPIRVPRDPSDGWIKIQSAVVESRLGRAKEALRAERAARGVHGRADALSAGAKALDEARARLDVLAKASGVVPLDLGRAIRSYRELSARFDARAQRVREDLLDDAFAASTSIQGEPWEIRRSGGPSWSARGSRATARVSGESWAVVSGPRVALLPQAERARKWAIVRDRRVVAGYADGTIEDAIRAADREISRVHPELGAQIEVRRKGRVVASVPASAGGAAAIREADRIVREKIGSRAATSIGDLGRAMTRGDSPVVRRWDLHDGETDFGVANAVATRLRARQSIPLLSYPFDSVGQSRRIDGAIAFVDRGRELSIGLNYGSLPEHARIALIGERALRVGRPFNVSAYARGNVGESLGMTVDHELAHVLQSRIYAAASLGDVEAARLTRKWEAAVRRHGVDARTKLSTYAGDDLTREGRARRSPEYFAESFSAWINGHGSRVSADLVPLLEQAARHKPSWPGMPSEPSRVEDALNARSLVFLER